MTSSEIDGARKFKSSPLQQPVWRLRLSPTSWQKLPVCAAFPRARGAGETANSDKWGRTLSFLSVEGRPGSPCTIYCFLPTRG